MRKFGVILAASAVIAVATAGSARAQSVYTNYYTPQFYGDHLVFFDENGSPIYYEDDQPYSVPTTYEYYNALVQHIQNNADAYNRWFEEVGQSNLNFRRQIQATYYTPQYYNDYPVYYDPNGMPVYYVDGRMYFVPRTYAGWHGYRNYYLANRHNYARWYRDYGYGYRWYRRPVYTSYYRPVYHDGYVVYYSDAGLPYYYVNGVVTYIPRHHPRFAYYSGYYRTHRVHYTRWHREAGVRYRTYRQPVSYRTRVVNTRAPVARRGVIVRTPGRTYGYRPAGRTTVYTRPGHHGRTTTVTHRGPHGGRTTTVTHRGPHGGRTTTVTHRGPHGGRTTTTVRTGPGGRTTVTTHTPPPRRHTTRRGR